MKAPGAIYRLGRKPDPRAPPDWALAGPDGTFGNRFDDPDATYRVLYASSQRLGCFVETLARVRIDPTLLAELAHIEGEDDYCPFGEVPIEWVEKRIMGRATTDQEYADVCSSEWISRLRKLLADRLSADDNHGHHRRLLFWWKERLNYGEAGSVRSGVKSRSHPSSVESYLPTGRVANRTF